MDDRSKELVNLYLEQIKYLRHENVSIQDKFIAGSGISLSILGVLVYYIEYQDLTYFYLFIPFLYFWLPYNVIKYTIRMLGINGYIEYLERKINDLVGEEAFSWNSRLINSGFFGGFSFVTTIVQIPLYVACSIFIIKKYLEVQTGEGFFSGYYTTLNILLIVLLLSISLMLVNLLFMRSIVLKKLHSGEDTVKARELIPELFKNSSVLQRIKTKKDTSSKTPTEEEKVTENAGMLP